MKTNLLAVAFLLAVAVAGSAATATVVVIPSELELGTLEPATVIRPSVWLLNTGDVPVELLSAKGSCGCTVLDFKPQMLASHTAVQVPVRITAPRAAGRSKRVNVTFTAVDHDPIKLPVWIATTGELEATTDVRAEPAEVDLGPVNAGNLISASARLVNTSDQPQRVTAARPSCKCVTLPDFEPVTIAAGEAIDVQLDIEVPTTLGSTSRDITFVLESRQVIKVPVRMKTTDSRIKTLKQHLGDLYGSTCSFDGFSVDGEVITAIAWERGSERPRARVTCSFNDDGTVRSTLVEPIRS